jgi:ABC-type amino acid transport substrate-binding protein
MTITFWLVGLLLVAQFTATVTSALTVQQLTSDIGGPEDLPGKRVATVAGSTAATYLDDIGVAFTPVATIEEAYALLAAGAVDAVVYDAPVLRYHSVSAGRGTVEVIDAVFKPEKYGIALPPGSELREPINEVLLEMYQDGTLSEIESRWFNE